MKKIILTLFCLASIINLQSQSTVTIGSGGNINGIQETSPINIFYRSHHCQIIYTAAELNTAGWIGQGMITKLGFNIAKAMPLLNFKKNKNDLENMFEFQEKLIYGEKNFNSQRLKQNSYLIMNMFNNLIRNQNYELDENLM